MADPKSENKLVNDVASPGKSAANATSRPIIVGHGPMMEDPMVQKSKDQEGEPKPATKPAPKIIEPPKGAASEVQTEKPAEPEPAKPTEPTATESDSSAVVDAVADQTKDKQKEDELLKAEAEKQAHLDQLVTEKKYFVPLGVSHRKKANRVGIVLLIVLALVVAAAAAAFTTGLVKL
jgi:hypothetical protein